MSINSEKNIDNALYLEVTNTQQMYNSLNKNK